MPRAQVFNTRGIYNEYVSSLLILFDIPCAGDGSAEGAVGVLFLDLNLDLGVGDANRFLNTGILRRTGRTGMGDNGIGQRNGEIDLGAVTYLGRFELDFANVLAGRTVLHQVRRGFVGIVFENQGIETCLAYT